MRPDKFFFPHEFYHKGDVYYGQKNGKKGEIYLALQEETCPFDLGDVLVQKQGSKERQFEVLDYDINESVGDGGGKYPFLASVRVKALDVKESPVSNTTHINFNAAVTASGDFQAGSVNTIEKHISVEQLQEAIDKSNDPEVKSLWQKLLDNPTFASIAATLAKGAIGQ